LGGGSVRTYKREVSGSRCVIVTNHPLASVAGAEAFAGGGNAFDSAAAALFALSVVEPMMVGIFGAGHMVLHSGRSGRMEALDNYAAAPLAANENLYIPLDGRHGPGENLFETVGRRNLVGHLSVATPGNLKAWEYLVNHYGKLSLAEAIEPAIRFARAGFRASPYLVHHIQTCQRDLLLYPETSRIFLPRGAPPSPGDMIVRRDYAETLARIAEEGSDLLYHGSLGEAVARDMESNGGVLRMEDLEQYRIVAREPVHCSYRDEYEVYSAPLSSSGGTCLVEVLNILENFDMRGLGFGSADGLHLFAEALKIAFADRQHFMGDPEEVQVPAEGLASKPYARERAADINLTLAGSYAHGEPALFGEGSSGGNTTHVSVMDYEGNVVSATQTIHFVFGSKVTTPGTGMLLNNCMAMFDPHPGRPNSVGAGKRVLSSMTPTILNRGSSRLGGDEGEPFMCIGTPGGTRIFAAVCQGIMNVLDHGMTIQEAVEAPRIWTMGMPGTDGEELHVEPGVRDEALDGLRRRGHRIKTVCMVAGGMNGILFDEETRMMHGGACWRADGAPVAVSGGEARPKAMSKRE
jgi:gamma-glutamyltranspeptidase/glutathione hydrolase